jgi:hypothetical protein
LAYWNKITWEILPTIKIAPYAGSKNGGYGITLVDHWSDPPMAWGT